MGADDKEVSADPMIDKCGKLLRANGQDGWTPVRYSYMYIYIFLYNKIAGNPTLYGLKSNSNDNNTIYNAIVKNIDSLIANYDLGSLGHHFNKQKFLKDMPNLNEHALEFSSVFERKRGEMVNTAEASTIMQAKTKKCRKSFLAVKGNTDYKDFIQKSGEENDKDADNGVYKREYYAALKVLREKQQPLRRARWKTFLFGALTIAAAAGTLVGLGALIGGGGALLSGMFGGVMASGTLGGAAAGLVGTVGGGLLAKTFVSRFRKSNAERRALKQDYKDFIRGEGKFAIKELEKGKQRGFRGIKRTMKYAMQARQIYTGYAKWKEMYESRLKPDKRKVDYKDEYLKYVKRHFRGYCRAYPDYEEEVKEAIYNHEVSDSTGIMKRVMGLLQPQNAAEERKNTMTVAERIQFANEMIKNSRNGLATLEDLKNKLFELEKDTTFFEGQNAAAEHAKLMNDLSHAIVEKVLSLANGPFTDRTQIDINDALADEKIQEAIKKAGIAGEIDELKSFSKIINQETSMLKTDLGVSINEQLEVKKSVMEGACTRLQPNMSSAELTAMKLACARIDSMKDQGFAGDIRNFINTGISDEKVKKYLLYMLDQKTKQSTVVVDPMVNPAVRNAITSLTDPDKAANVRAIINTIPDPVQRSLAQKALEDQVKALTYKNKLKITAGAFRSAKELKDGTIVELYKTISDIQEYSDGFDGGKLLTFKGSLQKIQNPELRNYMLMKLNEKVRNTYINHAKTKSSDFATDIDGIKSFLQKVNQSQLLAESQKDEIRSLVGKSLADALSSKMRNIHEGLFSGITRIADARGSALDLVNEYSKYLTESMYGGKTNTGFKEFFDLGTPESDALKAKVEYFKKTIGAIPSFLSVETKCGSQAAVFDSTSGDSKFFLRTFYGKDRVAGDKLFEIASNINSIYSNIEGAEAFKTGTADLSDSMAKTKIDGGKLVLDGDAGTLNAMNKCLSDIDSSGMPDDDKLAALIVLKKKCVGIFRAQMAKNIEGHGDGTELTTYIRDHAQADAKEQLKLYNNLLFKQIDDKIHAIDGSVRGIADEIREGLASSAKYQSFVNPTMGGYAPTMT